MTINVFHLVIVVFVKNHCAVFTKINKLPL